MIQTSTSTFNFITSITYITSTINSSEWLALLDLYEDHNFYISRNFKS